jgi:hypothetical protein
VTQKKSNSERRSAPRINSDISIAYQRISVEEANYNPYDARFKLSKSVNLYKDLKNISEIISHGIEKIAVQQKELGDVLQQLNKKIDVISQSWQENLDLVLTPSPHRGNLSETGLSFYAQEFLTSNTHLHIVLSSVKRQYHLAAIVKVIFCEEEDLEGFRVGVHFSSISSEDRVKLAIDVSEKTWENKLFQSFIDDKKS